VICIYRTKREITLMRCRKENTCARMCVSSDNCSHITEGHYAITTKGLIHLSCFLLSGFWCLVAEVTEICSIWIICYWFVCWSWGHRVIISRRKKVQVRPDGSKPLEFYVFYISATYFIWKIYVSCYLTDLLNALRLTKSQRYLLRRLLNVCRPPWTAASLGITQMLQK
jgi:hypothetical protein